MLANDNGFGVLNGADLLELKRVSAINAGVNPDDPTGAYYYPYSILNQQMTNWMREFTKVGLMQEYEINAQAGSDKGRFYASLSYQTTHPSPTRRMTVSPTASTSRSSRPASTPTTS